MNSKRLIIYLPLLIYFIVFATPIALSLNDADSFEFPYFSILFGIGVLIQKLGSANDLGMLVQFLPIEYAIVMLSILSITLFWSRKKIQIDYKKESLLIPLFIAGSYFSWAAMIIYYATTCSGKFCGIVSMFAIAPVGYLAIIFKDLYQHDWSLWLTIVLNALLFFVVSRALISMISRKISV